MPATPPPTKCATTNDAIAPITSWPPAPMLNRPQRNANPTEQPARTAGVAETMVEMRFVSAIFASLTVTPNGLPGIHCSSQGKPAPSASCL